MKRTFIYLIMFFFVALCLYPLIWTISTSLKPLGEVYTNPSLIPHLLKWGNYPKVWINGGISRAFFNSVGVTVIALFFHLSMVTLAGYAFARFPFPGRNFFFFLFLASMMIPGQVTLIPSYLLMRTLGIYNTRWSLYLPYAGMGLAISIYLMRVFFENLPKELEEVAKVDGASDFQIFLKIMLPLAKPAIATIAILRMLNYWNEFLWAFLMLQNEAIKTLQVKLQEFLMGYPGEWQLMSAALVISIFPILVLFFFLQKQFIRGFTQGALKG